jgi:two-component system chemotaxis response regulator CheB
VVGVLPSDLLDDGTAGLVEINRHGGVGIAQAPADAPFDSMPRSAIIRDHVQYVLEPAAIALVLARLARARTPEMEGPNGLVARADSAMYRAKAAWYNVE